MIEGAIIVTVLMMMMAFCDKAIHPEDYDDTCNWHAEEKQYDNQEWGSDETHTESNAHRG